MLKKMFLFMAVATAMTIGAGAQVRVDETWDPEGVEVDFVYRPYTLSIGPKVGANYAMMSAPQNLNLSLSGRPGFSAGAAANLRFARPTGSSFGAERFGVQLEALYAAHNFSIENESASLSCFEIPLLFQWYVIPMFAFEAGATFTGAFGSSPESLELNGNNYRLHQIRASDAMLTFGVNYKTIGGFNVSLRYNMGNSDIASNFQTKISTISIGIGWLFTVMK